MMSDTPLTIVDNFSKEFKINNTGSYPGKKLAQVSGILVLLATFNLSWFSVSGQPAHGLGLLNNIGGMFTNPNAMATAWGIPTFVPYILGGLFLFFLVSWLFLLIGAKNRACVIIGSLMPLILGWVVIVGYFSIPPNFMPYVQPFLGTELIPGIIPFNLGLMTSGLVTLNIGAFILIGGGILGFISGCMSR